MSLRTALSVAALTALAPFLAAGGGTSHNASEPLPTTPTLTVPGESKTPTVTRTSKTTTTDTTTTTSTTTATPTQTAPATTNPSTPSGGAAAPQTGGASPDTQQND